MNMMRCNALCCVHVSASASSSSSSIHTRSNNHLNGLCNMSVSREQTTLACTRAHKPLAIIIQMSPGAERRRPPRSSAPHESALTLLEPSWIFAVGFVQLQQNRCTRKARVRARRVRRPRARACTHWHRKNDVWRKFLSRLVLHRTPSTTAASSPTDHQPLQLSN